MNGDGVADLAVGAPFDDTAGLDTGSVSVHDPLIGKVIATMHGGAFGDRFGDALAGGGDWNGDGVVDLAVGSPGAETSALWSGQGKIEICSGSQPNVVLAGAYGSGAGMAFGFAVSEVADVIPGGGLEVAVGAPFASRLASRAGEVTLLTY